LWLIQLWRNGVSCLEPYLWAGCVTVLCDIHTVDKFSWQYISTLYCWRPSALVQFNSIIIMRLEVLYGYKSLEKYLYAIFTAVILLGKHEITWQSRERFWFCDDRWCIVAVFRVVCILWHVNIIQTSVSQFMFKRWDFNHLVACYQFLWWTEYYVQ